MLLAFVISVVDFTDKKCGSCNLLIRAMFAGLIVIVRDYILTDNVLPVDIQYMEIRIKVYNYFENYNDNNCYLSNNIFLKMRYNTLLNIIVALARIYY